MEQNEIGKSLANMRIVIEGAVHLFEMEVDPLYQLALENGRKEQALALDTLGAALNTLYGQIADVQASYADSTC